MSFKFFVRLASTLIAFLCILIGTKNKFAFQLQNLVEKSFQYFFQRKRVCEIYTIRFADLVKSFQPHCNEFESSFSELNTIKLPPKEKIQFHLKIMEMQYEFLVTLIETVSFALSYEDKNKANIMLATKKTKLDVIAERLYIQNTSCKASKCTENLTKKIDKASKLCFKTDKQSMSTKKEPCNKQVFENNVHDTTPFDFLNTAVGLLNDFNGEFNHLSKFLDSIDLINLIKGPFEELAVSLVKSKISSEIHHFLANASTLMSIKEILIEKVQGQSISTIKRKLQNAKQYSRNSFTYATYIRKLAYQLKQKYIFDGLNPETAEKYSMQTALSAITKNAKCSEMKIVMLASQFSTIDDIIAKFLEVTEELNNEKINPVPIKNKKTYKFKQSKDIKLSETLK